MRISTSMIYEKGVATIQQQTGNLLKTQQQVSTGRRILSPADDPIASARALELSQSKAVNKQFALNIGYADDNLKLFENKLVGVGDIFQYARERAVQAGNATLSAQDRGYIVSDLRSQFDALLGIANSRDGQGDYIFGGYKSNTKPYSGGIDGVTYNGDQGSRTIQVSASRFMPVSLPGADVFGQSRVIDVTKARKEPHEEPTSHEALYSFKGDKNVGTAGPLNVSFDQASVDASTDLGKRYVIAYSQPDPALTGTWTVERVNIDGSRDTLDPGDVVVVDPIPGIPPGAGTPGTLTFNGISVAFPVDPEPVDPNDPTPLANGDHFEIFVASTSVFENYAMFVSALEYNEKVGVGGAVAFGLDSLDFALESTLKVRAQVGSQMVETQQLRDVGDDLDLQYADAISRLEDVDYAEAISRLTRQQVFLEAAQMSFMRISNLSLFNFLN